MTKRKEKIAALEQELETETDEAKRENIETKLEGLNNELDKKVPKEHVSKEHIKKADEPEWVGRLEAKIENLLKPVAPDQQAKTIPTPPEAPPEPEPEQIEPEQTMMTKFLTRIWN